MTKKFNELRAKMSAERRQRNAELAAKLNSELDWPELCNTCHHPYVKGEISYCSNAFHCCRDCVWDDGRVVIKCEYHTEKHNN